MPFSHISCEDLASKLQTDSNIVVVDIRDPASYASGHITGAIHIDNNNVGDFLANTDRSHELVVCCYHGNSSQSAADFFNEQGFPQTYSLDGGYEVWKTLG